MQPGRDQRSVLLVEDDVFVRLTIAEELRRDGLTVLEAADAGEATAVLRKHAKVVAVLLTDIQMPGPMDGVALIELVRKRYPHARIIVLSGAGPKVLADLDADAVLTKPHSPEELLGHIRQYLPPGDEPPAGGRH